MKKSLAALCFFACASVTSCFALDVVYPKTQTVTINSPKTFFAGSADIKKTLTINGEEVSVDKSGGFARSVKLNEGENIFELKSGEETLKYVITRPKASASSVATSRFVEFDDLKYGKISADNTPLRSTPIDGGINRVSHLQSGTLLVTDGEQNGFYRVILGENSVGWIDKNSVEITPNGTSLAEFYGYDYIDGEDYFTFIFHLNHKIPWEIREDENQSLAIRLYNVSGEAENIYSYDFPTKLATEGRNLVGYGAEYVGEDLHVKIRKPLKIDPQKPLKNVVVTIDAGHGGSELGAVGCLGNKEKDLNLTNAKNLERALKSKGAKVVMTRFDDRDMSLATRVRVANKNESAVFISLHGNSIPDSGDPEKSRGFGIYYYYPEAKPLGEYILHNMQTKLPLENNGLIQASFYVVRNTKALSLLIEAGYMINPEDNAKLLDKKLQKQLAKSIAEGLEEYFRSQQVF